MIRQFVHSLFEVVQIAVIRYHQSRPGQPSGPRRLGCHPLPHFRFGHSSLHGPWQTNIVTRVDHDERPAEVRFEKWHLDRGDPWKSLQFISDPAEYQGMSDFFQSPELVGVGEHDPSERLAVYLAFEDDLRPPLGDRAQSFISQHRMAHRIGVDGADASHRQ